jgi:general stress protein 26
MKIEEQTNPDLAHLGKLIAHMSVAMLTIVEADGALACRPMIVLEMDANGALWFFVDLRSEKVEHLRVANLGFSDSAQGSYVSMSGRGEIDTDRGRIERLWTPLAQPWFPEGPDSSALALLKFVPDAADYWDAPRSKMTRAFGRVASAVLGQPVAMGEHGSHAGLSPEPTGGA